MHRTISFEGSVYLSPVAAELRVYVLGFWQDKLSRIKYKWIILNCYGADQCIRLFLLRLSVTLTLVVVRICIYMKML